jgi:hypothetical protein
MRRFDRRPSFAFALVLLPLLAGHVWADEVKKDEPGKYLRFVEEGNDGGRLETGIGTYTNGKGVTVDLIGAVHIADAGYYAALNKRFEGYDALCYEMVKPKDMGAPRKEQANGIGMVHFMQKMMKQFLELDYQLDGIDYTRKNFVHADLTAEEFNRMQDERGESMFTLMLQQMLREMAKGDNGKANAMADMDPMQLLAMLTSEDRARQLKLMLAKQFENMDDMVAGLEGPNGSVLVTERNKACLKVVKDQIDAGKKNLGVFYGAAHMKDMEKRLEDMGFKRTKMAYVIAWDMTPKGAAAAKPANGQGRAGQTDAAEDAKDQRIKELLEKLDRLEKRLDEVEKKK